MRIPRRAAAVHLDVLYHPVGRVQSATGEAERIATPHCAGSSTFVIDAAISLATVAVTASELPLADPKARKADALSAAAIIVWAIALLAILVRVGIWPLRVNSVYDVYVGAA